MPELHIVHQALTEYKKCISCKIKTFIKENGDINSLILSNLRFTFDKINFIITDIYSLMEDNKTTIRIGSLNQYYYDYDIKSEDLYIIKKNIRRINNCNYAKKSRQKKKNNVEQ